MIKKQEFDSNALFLVFYCDVSSSLIHMIRQAMIFENPFGPIKRE